MTQYEKRFWLKIAIYAVAAILGPVVFLSIYKVANAQTPLIRPDAKLTPGAPDAVTSQQNMTDTICPPHRKSCNPEDPTERWTTKCVRPPVSYTNRLKQKQIATVYPFQCGAAKDLKICELDHVIPLTLGGCPTCEDNLWLQSYEGELNAHVKDQCEVASNKLVCGGKVTLIDAQRGLATDWVAWCTKIGVIKPKPAVTCDEDCMDKLRASHGR